MEIKGGDEMGIAKQKKEWILIAIFIILFSLIGLYIVGDLMNKIA